MKGTREQGQVTFTQQVETPNILLKIDEVNLHIPTTTTGIDQNCNPPTPLTDLMAFFWIHLIAFHSEGE